MMGTDKRNWVRYNENLVQRGEILLRVDLLKNWKQEVAKMNEGKKGRPFAYPNIMMLLYGMMRASFQLPYRQLEGFARSLGKLLDMPAPAYSTFSIRLPKIPMALMPRVDKEKPVVLTVDSSGVKLTQKGQWLFHPHERKQFVKIHVTIDVDTKQVIKVCFSPGQFSDNKYFWSLIRGSQEHVKIEKVLADSGYDSTPNYSLLRRHGIKSGIKPRDSSNLDNYHKVPRTERSAVVRLWEKDPDQ